MELQYLSVVRTAPSEWPLVLTDTRRMQVGNKKYLQNIYRRSKKMLKW